ncbi:MAG: hypothetical protein U5N86_11290 [Planctomycetota bacterium]|nr:hypothetical protein [Planctomycetota bacterium]
MGYFKRLVTPDDEEAFVDGCRELYKQEWEKALVHLSHAEHIPDGAFLAGMASMKLERFEEACRYLASAAERSEQLNALLGKYGLTIELNMPITVLVAEYIRPDKHGALLALTEANQRLERYDSAVKCLYELHKNDPDDVVVRLSLVEILMQQYPSDRAVDRQVVRLCKGIENESTCNTARTHAIQGSCSQKGLKCWTLPGRRSQKR